MKISTLIIISFLVLTSCTKDPVVPIEVYSCNLSFIDNSDAHPKRLRFENAIKKLKQVIPGVQASVRSIDGNIWTGSQGLVDINNGITTEKCSRYLVGSVSKIFTSTLILLLQEEGLLSIDDPIENWIESELIDKIENAKQVTIKNLLMHTSGIKEYIGVKFQIDRLNNSKLLLTPTQKLKYIFNKDADFAPNTGYGYSNTNYVLLGLIIEKVSKISLDKAVKLKIADVVGLENTKMGTSQDPIPSGTSRPYLNQSNGHFIDVMNFALSDAATGDGGIISNTQDLLLFIESIVENSLISSTSYDQMLDNKVEIKTDKWYGLGIELENKDNGFRIAHSGGTEGYLSFLMNYPNSNVTVAICINSSSENGEIVNEIISFINELQEIAFE
tara:strand:+ start:1903 stop:3063 length:1161 start_codon:yes stop_codon:yes gene_type:complete